MKLTELILASDTPIEELARRASVYPSQLQKYLDGKRRAITITQQEQIRQMLIDDETDDNDGLDWAKLADKYEPPAPKGAEYWGYGSFYKITRNRVWIYVDCEWIKSNKPEYHVRNYARVEEK